jgi:muramidase (phage lysozyme)
MAVNPITTEDLTINFSDLLKIPVGNRVQAAMLSPDYSNALLNSLTPIQMAKAFPDYYRRELPDISNFILGNRYLDEHGAGAFHQRGGGDYGEQKGTAAPPPPPKSIVDKILEGAQITEIVDGVVKRDAGQRGELGFTQDTKMDPRKRALLDAIATDSGGGYGTVNYVARGRGTQDVTDLSQGHPFITADGRVLKGYTASGRYQMLATNYDTFAKKIGAINPETGNPDFSPEAQDRVAWEMAKDVYRKGTGGRNLEEDINNPNITPEQLIRPMSIDYGWHILKSESGIRKATNVFNENEAIYQQDVKTAIEEAAKKETGPKVQVSPEVAEILNSNPETKKYFIEDKPDMGVRLQEQINAGIMSIDDLKNKIRSNSQQIGELIRTTEEMAAIGGDAIVNPEQSRVKEDQAKLAGTRKLPLQEDLKGLMDYSAQKLSEETGRNISMQVFSGGQAALGTAGPRTGSTEHDLGGAADVYFIETMPDGSTRRLSMRNPEDKELMYKAAYHFSRAGGRSVGLESGYMGDEAMHLGISRNKEDPVHHGDDELKAIVNQGRNEYLTEAREQGWDLRYGYQNYLEREKAARIAAYEEKNKAKEEKVVAESKASNNTMLISMGTNDWGNEDMEPTYNNAIEAIKQARAKGYNPVLVAPVGSEKFKKVHDTISKAATDMGVKVEQPLEYDEDGYHPTQKESQRLAEMYPGATVVGDSIANRIGTYTKDGKTIATDGIQTGAVLENINSDKVQAIPTYQYGGTPETQDDEDLMAVGSDGNPVFRFNSGEGLYVKPEANEYADEKMAELSGRLDDLSSRFDTPNEQSQMQQSRPRTDQKNPWSQKVIAADRPRSPSADRANRRTKFMNEGWRPGGRGSPNSITS